MTSGYYFAAIIGAVVSFIAGCIWYTVVAGKAWQKEMGLSDDRIKAIFVPKKMLLAFVCEWLAAFCTIGIFVNLPVSLIHKVFMLVTVLVFQGVKLSIFDGKSMKVIFINEGYRVLSIVILAITYTIFI
ncbi:DUF1761 domain-containing protein [Vagococcus sp. BWB3-3]|uniref:DUF1761 domain-containing protein n=1 Tax=Vagococcus allomyrinae TaxID=2794353 RepID=A0A940SST1_9ENTE|nr:DUF1761 domain-containing protein [Vagococcus allomyrinae]MBP1042327.1 DUF1761 domain-containing protein [Vagococcus allomyrinae]